MKETACIVAAGKGTRSYHYPFLHKALLPLGNKAVLSRCIESLSKGGIKKFIIALQKGEENRGVCAQLRAPDLPARAHALRLPHHRSAPSGRTRDPNEFAQKLTPLCLYVGCR